MFAQWYADGVHRECVKIAGSEIEYVSTPVEEFHESAHFDFRKHGTPN